MSSCVLISFTLNRLINSNGQYSIWSWSTLSANKALGVIIRRKLCFFCRSTASNFHPHVLFVLVNPFLCREMIEMWVRWKHWPLQCRCQLWFISSWPCNQQLGSLPQSSDGTVPRTRQIQTSFSVISGCIFPLNLL